MQKRVMNGSVVSQLDKPKLEETAEKCDEYYDMFYNGEKLSEFEQDVQRIYLSNKLQKHVKF
jgi:hypothetical protein